MKQTLQSILTASDALFPDISAAARILFSVTQNRRFRCNEEIAVFLQDPDFQNRLCKQDFVDILFVLKGNCTCKFYKADLTIAPESVFLSRHSFLYDSASGDSFFSLIMAARSFIFFKLDSLRSHYSDLISANNALLLFFFSNMLYQSHYWNYLYFSVSTQISWILCWLKCTKNSIVNRFIIKICFIIHPVRFYPYGAAVIQPDLCFAFNPLRLVRYDQIYSYICDNYPMTSARKLQSIFISVNLISANCFTKTVPLLPPSFKKSGFSKPEVFWSKATFLFRISQSWWAITI